VSVTEKQECTCAFFPANALDLSAWDDNARRAMANGRDLKSVRVERDPSQPNIGEAESACRCEEWHYDSLVTLWNAKWQPQRQNVNGGDVKKAT
jgi:hypothetical protein